MAEAPPDAPPADAGNESFEGCLDRLEQVVERLESGELPLEEALAAFEEGVRLSRRCSAQLEQAEQRVEILSQDGELRPLDPNPEGGG